MKIKMTRSSGNVFKDLGFTAEEAEHLKIRSRMMVHQIVGVAWHNKGLVLQALRRPRRYSRWS